MVPAVTLAWYADPGSLVLAENATSAEADGYALVTPPDPPFARGERDCSLTRTLMSAYCLLNYL